MQIINVEVLRPNTDSNYYHYLTPKKSTADWSVESVAYLRRKCVCRGYKIGLANYLSSVLSCGSAQTGGKSSDTEHSRIGLGQSADFTRE